MYLIDFPAIAFWICNWREYTPLGCCKGGGVDLAQVGQLVQDLSSSRVGLLPVFLILVDVLPMVLDLLMLASLFLDARVLLFHHSRLSLSMEIDVVFCSHLLLLFLGARWMATQVVPPKSTHEALLLAALDSLPPLLGCFAVSRA